jgi:hypothetical protein
MLRLRKRTSAHDQTGLNIQAQNNAPQNAGQFTAENAEIAEFLITKHLR